MRTVRAGAHGLCAHIDAAGSGRECLACTMQSSTHEFRRSMGRKLVHRLTGLDWITVNDLATCDNNGQERRLAPVSHLSADPHEAKLQESESHVR